MTTSIRTFFSDQTWREDRVGAYASIGILVFLTSFFWAPTRDFMHVVYGVSFFAPVLLLMLLRRPKFKQYGGWFTAWALLYAGYASLSTLWSDAPRVEFFAQHFLFLAVWLAGTAWLASRDGLDILKLCRVLVITGAVASVVYQIIFHVQGYPVGYATDAGTRLGLLGLGVTRNANTIGLVFGVTTILAYVWWLESTGPRQGCFRFCLLSSNGIAVLAAQGRGPILAMAFTLGLGLALYRGPSRKWKTHVLAGLILFGGLTVAFQQQIITNRWNSAAMASSLRPEIWEYLVTKSVEEDQVLFGSGLPKTTRIYVPGLGSCIPYLQHGHNAFVDAFYWTGLVGLILMCVHMVYVFRHWSNSRLMLPLFLWFLFGCLTALVDRPGFFEHLNSHWFAYWIPAGLIGAAISAQWSVESRDTSA
jgi:hypothetical protein